MTDKIVFMYYMPMSYFTRLKGNYVCRKCAQKTIDCMFVIVWVILEIQQKANVILTSCFCGARGRAVLNLARTVTGSVPEIT